MSSSTQIRAVRCRDQIAVARMHHHVVHRHRRQIRVDLLPVGAAVE
jgi:hypothetical protein